MAEGARDAWDLLPAYALDAVDDLERRVVERLLADDAEARRALDEYREVVAAFTVEQAPPERLRDEVLASVASTPQTTARPARRAGVRRRWLAVAVSAAAVVAVAVPTTVAVQAVQEQRRLQEQVDTVADMMADPAATLWRSEVAGGGHATVLAAGGDFLFSAGGLPEVDAGTVYQLWLVEPDGGVASAGLLEPTDGSVEHLVRDVTGVGLAVSVEPAGGSEQPTTDPIVVLVEG